MMHMPYVLKSKSIRIDPRYFTCTVRGKRVALTADQFRLLYCLMQEPGRVFTRQEIIRTAKGDDYPATPKSVDIAIHRLRSRINVPVIGTIVGMGYRFEEEVERGKKWSRKRVLASRRP
jgi:DNA-binding response OmpR family regulator